MKRNYIRKQDRKEWILKNGVVFVNTYGSAALTCRSLAKFANVAYNTIQRHYSNASILQKATLQYARDRGFDETVAYFKREAAN